MSEILQKNKEYAEAMKGIMKLRGEPVAVKLVRKGEAWPEGYTEPEAQMSHCQAIFKAREGGCFKLPLKSENCMVGCSALNMTATPEKVASGEFHAGIGMHDSAAAAGKMISDRMVVPFECEGEVVCPLKDADFVPDVVTIEDIPLHFPVPVRLRGHHRRAHLHRQAEHLPRMLRMQEEDPHGGRRARSGYPVRHDPRLRRAPQEVRDRRHDQGQARLSLVTPSNTFVSLTAPSHRCCYAMVLAHPTI